MGKELGDNAMKEAIVNAGNVALNSDYDIVATSLLDATGSWGKLLGEALGEN